MQQHCSDYSDSCAHVISQAVDIGLPITLKPAAHVGAIKIKCCGSPYVELCQCQCGNGGFELKVTQTITYKIPIDYSITANTGEVTLGCSEDAPPQKPCSPY